MLCHLSLVGIDLRKTAVTRRAQNQATGDGRSALAMRLVALESHVEAVDQPLLPGTAC